MAKNGELPSQDNNIAAVWEPLTALKPWAANPRNNSKAVAEVAKSIRRFGWGAPIVANRRDGEIIAGHTRFAAAERLKLEQVPVRWLDLDPADAHALAIADNKVGEVATWDDATLANVLRELREADESLLGDTGFSDEEIANLLGEVTPTVLEPEGEPPEVDEQGPVHSVLGEVYQLGPHRLMCGDSTSVDAVEQLMVGEKADMVFTSPPYNVGKSASLSGKTPTSNNKYGMYRDDKTQDDYLDLLIEFTNTWMMASTVLFVNLQQLAGNKIAFIKYLHHFRDHLVDIAIWDKGHGAPQMAANVMSNRFEYLIFLSPNTNPSRAIPCASFQGTVQNVYAASGQRDNEFADVHAATFPVHLPTWAVKTFTQDGAIISDAFGGTGTTLIACAQSNRIARLMELDPRYCDVIRRRWTRWAKANGVEAGSGALDG